MHTESKQYQLMQSRSDVTRVNVTLFMVLADKRSTDDSKLDEYKNFRHSAYVYAGLPEVQRDEDVLTSGKPVAKAIIKDYNVTATKQLSTCATGNNCEYYSNFMLSLHGNHGTPDLDSMTATVVEDIMLTR